MRSELEQRWIPKASSQSGAAAPRTIHGAACANANAHGS
jgi:hypothetical protein